MGIATSARIAGSVLALTLAARPMEAQQQAAVSVPRSVLERYVGEYVYPAGNLGAIRLMGDTLIRQLGAATNILTPVSETRFRMGAFTVDFMIDQAGAVTKVLRTPDGGGMWIPRRAPGAPPPTMLTPGSSAPLAPGVRVPKAVLERYVGDYPFTPRLTIAVRVNGDDLTGQQAGGEALFLIPVSETRFKVGAGPMEVEFVTDQAGGVTQVVRQGTYEMRAVRKRRS